MNREGLLNQKAGELREALVAWAAEHSVLRAGEKIVFSFRIEKTYPLVERDPGDLAQQPEPMQISRKCTASYQGTFVKPAELSPGEIAELLGRVPGGRAFKDLETLLVSNRNNPTHLGTTAQREGNRALRSPLNGKHFRLAAGSNGSQLWEVEPSA